MLKIKYSKILIIIIPTFVYTTEAYAYIGPGLGLGALSVIFGIFAVILLGIFGILYYPIKSLYLKIKNRKKLKEKKKEID
tara:strand:+ start:78 stop:317 length:240 start_codon:yes stop_codon:yes gene_type:complete